MNRGGNAVAISPRNVSPPPEIAGRLRELRVESGAGQEEFARKLKIPARTYQSYERAESWLSCAFLQEIARVGINVNWLLTGIGERRAAQPLRLRRGEGSNEPGRLNTRLEFEPLQPAVMTGEERKKLQLETEAMMRRITRPGVMAEISGIDADLAHRLADLHQANMEHERKIDDDGVGPLLSLIQMLDQAYEAADLRISSADVGRIAAEEYRSIYEGGETVFDRNGATKATRARHIRAAAWAAKALLSKETR